METKAEIESWTPHILERLRKAKGWVSVTIVGTSPSKDSYGQYKETFLKEGDLGKLSERIADREIDQGPCMTFELKFNPAM